MCEYRDFLFYGNYRACYELLPIEFKNEFLNVLVTYGTEGVLPKTNSYIEALMSSIIPNIDKSCLRYQRAVIGGQKGGRPRQISRKAVIILYKQSVKQNEIAEKLSVSSKSVQRIVKEWKSLNDCPK